MKSKYIFLLSVILLSLWPLSLYAIEEVKISVAIFEFSNNTGQDSYDYLEKALPKTLVSELSHSKRIVIVEREKIDKILTEHELNMAGVTSRSKVGKMGKLLAADYIIHGNFTFLESKKEDKRILINANYVKVKSGAVKSVKAKGAFKFLDGHIELLSNNLRHKIAGETDYMEKLNVGRPYSTYFLIGSGACLLTTGVLHYFFLDKREDYRSTKTLNDIEDNYDSTETFYWVRNSMFGVSLIAISLTVVSYVFNWGETGEVLAFLPSGQLYLSQNLNNNYNNYNNKESYNITAFYTKRF